MAMVHLLLTLALVAGAVSVESVTVQTQLGTIIGTQVETTFLDKTGKVNMFRGIPYAEAPGNANRFQKPVPKGKLPQPFNATDFGPACPQDYFMLMGWVPGFPYLGDDCLSINVFVPDNKSSLAPNQKFPVMLYIYGGAYVIGQSKIYSAENLTLVGDVIVVTFNYRVSALGFLSTGTKYRGNAGLWDQQLAIKWVHDNIADFGGDPNSVLLFGESAGGSSVIFQALYPGNKGYFRRILSQSGSPMCPWAYQPEPQKFARRLANNLGCTDADLDAAVDCLQKLDVQAVANATIIGKPEETAFRAEWDVVVDGEFVTRDQMDIFRSGTDVFRDLDLLIGINNNDGAFITLLSIQPFMKMQLNRTLDTGLPPDFFKNFYVPMYIKERYGNSSQLLEKWITHEYTDWSDTTDPIKMRQRFLEFSSDFNFFMPVLSALQTHAEKPARSKAYLYEFFFRPTFNTWPTWVEGASHGEDLPFVFGFPWTMADGMKFKTNVPDWEKRISRNMMIMWSNFAKTGDPNKPVTIPDNIVWPQYNEDSRQFLKITANRTVASRDLLGSRRDFWLEIEPQLFNTQMQGPIVG